jgi:hypothetical protein
MMKSPITRTRRAPTRLGAAWLIATGLATWALVAAGTGPADDARVPVGMQDATHQR